jgi:hypothetical protein
LAIGSLYVDLDEGARQPFLFPRGSRLAGLQPHGDVFHSHSLPRLQRQVAHDPVALVEQPKHGNALSHWRDARLIRQRTRHFQRHRFIAGLLGLLAASEQRQRYHQCKGARSLHYYSGFQAS